MKHRLIAVAAFILAFTNVNSQAKLVEKVTKKGNEIVIPYEKYVLSNGLTLIIHEDHSDPLVHVDITYHVGSAREEIGKSGFAHFFEHMILPPLLGLTVFLVVWGSLALGTVSLQVGISPPGAVVLWMVGLVMVLLTSWIPVALVTSIGIAWSSIIML